MKNNMKSTKIDEIDSTDTIYGTTWIAWLQLVNIILVNTACSIMWMTSCSAPVAVSEWLGVSFTLLNWISNSSAIINCIFALVTGWSYNRFGIKLNIIFACVMNCIGCWVRCLAIIAPEKYKYPVLMVGQVIASIGGPFVYSISATLTAVWFAPEHRPLANTLSTLSLGMALAPIVIPIITPTAADVPKMLISISIFNTICSVPSIFLPARPLIPSSPSADQDRMDLVEGIRCLMKNKSFWWIALLCTINIGIQFSIVTVVIEAVTPYGYTDQQSGYFASAIITAGIVGGIYSGSILGKTGQYVMMIKILTPLMVITYLMFVLEITANAFNSILMACVLNGIFSYALFPIQIEFACEVCYPVPESVVAAVLWSLGTGASVIFTVILDSLRAGPNADPPNNMSLSLIVITIIVFIGSLPVLWLKGDLQRLNFDLETQK